MPQLGNIQRTASERSSASGDSRRGHERSSSNASVGSAHRTESAGLVTGRSRLGKIAQGHTAFSQMVLMQCTVEDALLVAKYGAADPVAHGVPYLAPTAEGKEEARSIKLSHHHPQCYKLLRAHFGVDIDDYYRALACTHWMQAAKGDPGFFFAGMRYCVKIISAKESKSLAKLVGDYHKFVTSNPSTTLLKLYGHHEAAVHGKSICFVVFNNLLPLDVPLSLAFNVSGGSSFQPAPIEDLGFSTIPGSPKLLMGDGDKEALLAQLERDTDFLKSKKISPYTLSVGRQRHRGTPPPEGYKARTTDPRRALPANVTDVYQVGVTSLWARPDGGGHKLGFGGLGSGRAYQKKLLAGAADLFS